MLRSTMLVTLASPIGRLRSMHKPHFDSPSGVDVYRGRARLVVLTDIGNEPDDQMSFVRLLLYSNEIELEGLVATTSTWQKDKLQPETCAR